jgi:3-phenylpropionate/trans-cinnamate dioxygenase ferredoxin subunit
MEVFMTKLSTIQQKKKMRIVIENRPILLTYTKNGVFAIRDKCPHMGATLSNGRLKDGVITCKDHGLPISVETGEVTDKNKANFLRLDEYSLSVRTYKTMIRDESVYIDL